MPICLLVAEVDDKTEVFLLIGFELPIFFFGDIVGYLRAMAALS